MILANIEKRAASLNAFKKVLLKYFIVIQSHWILTICFFVYTVYIMGESSVNSVLSLICLESVNTTKFKLCPTQLMTNEFFSWKNEISYRKSGQPNSQSSYYLVSLQKLFQSYDNKNQTDSKMRPNYNYIDDIYLLMISVSLICFFICVLMPLVIIRTNNRFRKIFKLNTNDLNESKVGNINFDFDIEKKILFISFLYRLN
jgi:hypothetical protein